MSEINADGVSRRIRALLTKTVENGCTEEEAMAAAAKARELMDAHRLEMSDIEVKAEPVADIMVGRQMASQISPADYCMQGIGRYCGVKLWFSFDGFTRKVRILGLKNDVEMASYLYEMITKTIRFQCDHVYYPVFRKEPGAPTRTGMRRALWDFQVGMASRINHRLDDMARALEPTAKTGTGTALVVVKNAIVDQAFDALGLVFGKKSMSRSVRHSSSYVAGQAAGDRVNLGRPVGEAHKPRLQ